MIDIYSLAQEQLVQYVKLANESEKLLAERDDLQAKLAQAQARIAELETALDPFSDFAEAWDGTPESCEALRSTLSGYSACGFAMPDDTVITYARRGCPEPDVFLTAGNIRAARTARRGKVEPASGTDPITGLDPVEEQIQSGD